MPITGVLPLRQARDRRKACGLCISNTSIALFDELALSRASSSNPASDALAVSQISGCGDSKAGGDVVVTVTLVSVEPPPPPPQAERSVNISRLEKL